MMIAFAALGDARTTRQGRGATIAIAVTGVVALRIAGFAASSAAVRTPMGVVWIYGAPLAAMALSAVLIFQGSLKQRLSAGLSATVGRLSLRRLPGLSRA
jgi:lipopolysaccharide export system permease protein